MSFRSHAADLPARITEGTDLPATVVSNSIEQYQAWTCSTCQPPRKFAYKKTLLKHERSIHGQTRIQCSQCTRQFNRKDLKDRHEAEQHMGLARMVKCAPCNQWILCRALGDHLSTQRHRQKESEADEVRCREMAPDKVLFLEFGLSTESVIDPLVLMVQLFCKTEAFGSGPTTWIRVSRPFKPSHEVRELMGLGMRVLERRLRNVEMDTMPLVWSIAMLATVTAMIDGWPATQPHQKALRSIQGDLQSSDTWMPEKMWDSIVRSATGASAEKMKQTQRTHCFNCAKQASYFVGQDRTPTCGCCVRRVDGRRIRIRCIKDPVVEQPRIQNNNDSPTWVVSFEKFEEEDPWGYLPRDPEN